MKERLPEMTPDNEVQEIVTISDEVPAFLHRFMRPVESSMFAELWRPMHSRYGSTLDVFVEPGRFSLVLGAKMGSHRLFKYQIDGFGPLTMDRPFDVLLATMKTMHERLKQELLQAGMRHYGIEPRLTEPRLTDNEVQERQHE